MRKAFGIALMIAAGWGAAGIVGSGCGLTNDPGGDCPPEVSARCCPCPFPEACPDPDRPGFYESKPIPWDCPNACDGPPPLPEKCSDAGADGGTSSLCVGDACVLEAPQDWHQVAFFSDWREPPPCPEHAPRVAFDGLPAPPPLSCAACTCDAPEGTCKLPETWTVSSTGCDDPGGGVKTNFDPPVDWDGTCNQEKSILSSTLCGGVPCVQSITISTPVIEEQPCTPRSSAEPLGPVPRLWNGGPETPFGRVCTSDKPWPSCAEQEGKVCGPGSDDYASCIFREGEHLCPEGWGGERHVLYGKIKDDRECSACTCGSPTGGTCEVEWHAFHAGGCTMDTKGYIYAGMIAPCIPLMPGTQLSGKAAELLNYTKGTCTPGGGEAIGELTLDKPATVCCAAPTS